MTVTENALIIFALAPRPGTVKKRLTPTFTPDEAREIHLALLGDVMERSARALAGSAALILAWSEPAGGEPAIVDLPAGFRIETQSGSDLGERMALSIQSAIRSGHRRVAILGSDTPTLPADHLTGAFDALRKAEVVVGPATDGGYYLIGMSKLHLELFRGVPWGTPDVMNVTRKRLKKSGISVVELGVWHDVDTPEDVARLWKDLIHMKDRRTAEIPMRTFRVLARLAPGRIPAV